MKKKYNYNHIVPVTYQKRWHTDKGPKNVYYFDKELNLLSSDGSNANKKMGIENYYILTQQDIELINLRADGEEQQLISDPTIVEEYFDNAVETRWKYVLELFEDGSETIETPIKKHFYANIDKFPCGLGIKGNYLKGLKSPEWLKDFIITQWARRFENVSDKILETIDVIKKYILETCKEATEKEIDKELKDKDYLRTLWLAGVIDSKNEKENSLIKIVKDIFEVKFTCVTVFSEKLNFILSDNPVIYNIGKNTDNLIGGGYYMPLSPNTLISFLDCSKWGVAPDDIVAFKANDKFVKYINRKLVEQAIEKVGFYNLDISDHIADEKSTETGIKEMFDLTD